MRQTALIVFGYMSLLIGNVMAAGEEQKLEAGMVNPGYVDKPKWFKLSLMELPDDLSEATKANKRLVLYFYQDGCPYCEILIRDNFGKQEIVDKFQENFDLIAINMWGDKEVVNFNGDATIEKDFASSLKVMYTPTMLFLNEQGEVALRINGYYYPDKFSAALDYVANKKEKETSFLTYYKEKKTDKASATLHIEPGYLQPPYNLKLATETSKRPLLVMFEEPYCKLCDELHLDILQQEETKEAIKAFDVVLLNARSNGFLITPQGKAMRINDWANQLNVKFSPSLVFFDTVGVEVFRTEAYLRTFHIAGAMNYVSSGQYKKQPSFQRYLQDVVKVMSEKGIKVDLMN